MKRILLGMAWLFFVLTAGNAQNVSLDFDGVDDNLTYFPLPINNNDFTVEMWFLSKITSTNTNCSNNFRKLFSLYGTDFSGGTLSIWNLEVGLCGGELNADIREGGGTQPIVSLGTTNFNTGLWNHFAVTKSGNTLNFYVNCQPFGSPVTLTTGFDFETFYLGASYFAANYWLGEQDDVRLWNFAKTQTQVEDQKHCVLTGNEPGLMLYWNFDEGIPSGNNSGAVAVDNSPNGYDGTFNGFTLNGNTSNYIESTAPMAYPNLNNIDIEIKDYPYQNNLLTEVCPDDPAHFSLLKDGVAPGPFSNVTVQWYYDDGLGPVSLARPPFSDFRFPIMPGVINYDCANSTTGSVNRTYYAISSVKEMTTGEICDYRSDNYNLKICCPISPATVNITPPNPLCEGETPNVTVCLNSPDLFVQTPGPDIDIEWYVDGVYAGFTDQICFNYTIPSITGINTPTPFCFEARVTNCNGKTGNFSSCLTIDPEPVCGTIEGWPLGSPLNLDLVSTSPHLIYEICPGNDAIVGVNVPFQKCNPQWQYSFTPGNPPSWVNMGFSNTVQNTNILPTAAWTSNSIFYRIECQPLSNPSGCEPCYSEMIEIRLKTPPPVNAISGNNQLCAGQINTLSVVTPNPAHTYTWYCDGLQVATGPDFTYSAVKSACYWFESTDGCYVVESPQFCVEVCEVIPVLSCPLPPNDCACLGDPITISACDSYSTCSPANLQFIWYINGVQQSTTACTLTDTPLPSGTTYQVDIFDSVTGCSASAQQTVVPCDKNP